MAGGVEWVARCVEWVAGCVEWVAGGVEWVAGCVEWVAGSGCVEWVTIHMLCVQDLRPIVTTSRHSGESNTIVLGDHPESDVPTSSHEENSSLSDSSE